MITVVAGVGFKGTTYALFLENQVNILYNNHCVRTHEYKIWQ